MVDVVPLPMKRGGNLKRNTPLKAKSTMKRRRPKGELLRMDLDRFDLGKVVWPAKCFAAGRKGACSGKLDLHHIVEKGRIRTAVPAEFGAQLRAKRDSRNLLVVCRGHHDLIHRSSIHVEEADLPEDFWQFVAAYSLGRSLPRHLSGAIPENAQEAA